MIQPIVQEDYLTTYNNAGDRRRRTREERRDGESDNVPQSVMRVLVKRGRPRASRPKKRRHNQIDQFDRLP